MRRFSHPNFNWLLAGIFSVTLSFSIPVFSSDEPDQVDRLKAAVIYQLTNFVTWPEGSFREEDDPIHICIVGNEAIYAALTELVARNTRNKKKIEIHYKKESEDLENCHILYIDSSVKKNYYEHMADVELETTLTIGDDDGFISHGGVIRIFLKKNRLQLEINIDTAREANIKISSQVLKLATITRN